MVPRDKVAHVCRGVLVELLVVAEHKDGYIDGAEHRKLVRLLEQAALALEKGPMFVSCIFPIAAWRGTYTERLRSSLMALISIFLRPIVDVVVARSDQVMRRVGKLPVGNGPNRRIGDEVGRKVEKAYRATSSR